MELSDLRRILPIPFVMSMRGHDPVSNEDGKLHYQSPFRQDNNPSFDVWLDDEKGWRWGDYAEGTQGSVIDLVQRFNGDCDDKEAIKLATLTLQHMSEVGYTPPVLKPIAKEFDADGAKTRLQRGRKNARRAIMGMQQRLAESHPGLAAVSTDDLHNEWRLSSDGDSVLIPYFNADGETIGYKTRRPDDEKRNAKGMSLAVYGIWKLANDNRPIFLTEGETDPWATQSALPEFLCLGLPGSGHFPDKLDGVSLLAGRVVYLALDGDKAGREALKLWSAYLANKLGCEVHVVPMPEGRDPAGLTPDQIRELPARARVRMPAPDNFEKHMGQYCRISAKGDDTNYTPVSNWTLRLARTLRGTDGEMAYEGSLLPAGTPVVLPASALLTPAKLASWAQAQGVDWYGTGNTAGLLAALLRSESFLVPEGRMTGRVGFHDGDFVWHNGHIGTDDWTYVPPINAIDIPNMVDIQVSACSPAEVLQALGGVYAPEVMSPLLAWLAVAPLRPLFKQFPSVVVSGASGTGKTTLVEQVLRVFSGASINATLTNTTAHAVASFFGSANAVPVWFDEYRPGARVDAKQQLDQMLRDAYTGQKSYKGGMYENKQALGVYDSDVPIIVTGEDSMIETSITDRSIMLRLTKSRQGNMRVLQQMDWSGFAHNYLMWLLDELPYINVVPEGPEDLNDRQRYNLGVLRVGAGLLSAYLQSINPMAKAFELDLSLVTTQAAEAAAENPIMDAVSWALEQELRCVWSDEEATYVSPDQLLAEVKRIDIFTLPVSNSKGLRQYLIDTYDGTSVRKRGPGDQHPRSVIAIPCGTIEA